MAGSSLSKRKSLVAVDGKLVISTPEGLSFLLYLVCGS